MKHILVKIPTRSRPDDFLRLYNDLKLKESGNHKITYLISIDDDDATMHTNAIKDATKDSLLISAPRAGKIGSVNRDMEYAPNDYDIVMQPADDFIVKLDGWDNYVVEEMEL